MREWGVVCLYDANEGFEDFEEPEAVGEDAAGREPAGMGPVGRMPGGREPAGAPAWPVGDPDAPGGADDGTAAWWRHLARAFTPNGGPGESGDRGDRGGRGDAEGPEGRDRPGRNPGVPAPGKGSRPAGPTGGGNGGTGDDRQAGSFGIVAERQGEHPGGEYDYGTEDAEGWAFLEALGRMVTWLAATLAANRESGDPWAADEAAEVGPVPVCTTDPSPSWHRPYGPFGGW